MNGQLNVRGGQHNDLEQVARAVWADDEPAVGVFAGVFDEERMVDGVVDVVVVDTVLARRLLDLTGDIVLQKDRSTAVERQPFARAKRPAAPDRQALIARARERDSV